MTSEYLSPEGRRRKAEMAELLTTAVVHRRRRRRAVQAASLVAVVALAVWLLRSTDSETKMPEHGPVARFQQFDFEVATGSRETVASWIVKPTDTSRFRVGDAELIHLLEEAGHPSGILRVGNRVVLTRPFESSDD